MNQRDLASCGFGVLVGFGTHLVEPLPPPSVPEVPEFPSVALGPLHQTPTRQGPEPAACKQEVEDLSLQLATADDDLALKTFERAMARGRRVAREGVPLPWLDATPELVRPEVFGAQVNAALDDVAGRDNVVDVELLVMDCSEMPCVVAFAVELEEPPLGTSQNATFVGAMESEGYGDLAATSTSSWDDDGHMVHVHAYYPRVPVDGSPIQQGDIQHRVQRRVKLVVESLDEASP